MVVRLFLLLAVVCLSRGQTPFYDIGDGIYQGNTRTLTATSENRKLCYDGDTTYYVDADADPSQIREIGSADPVRTVTGATIDSLSCACDILAFTYRLNGRTYLEYREVTEDDVYIEIDLAPATVTAIRLQIELDVLIVVSSDEFWKFSLNVKEDPTHIDLTSSLTDEPKCVAVYQDTSADPDRWYLFISFGFRTGIVVVSFETTLISQQSLEVQRPNGGNARVACLDVDGDGIFFLHESSGTLAWEVNRYDVDNWLSDTSPPYSSADRDSIINGEDEDFDDCVNGLDICGTACQDDCADTTDCECTNDCGFCVSGDDTCQCQNSALECCVYYDDDLADVCLNRLPPINAMCVIKNARPQRRKLDEVFVLGVSKVDAVITIPRRTVKTGRWDIDVFPPNTVVNMDDGPPWIYGFRASTQSSARGKRFGVFLADINPVADGLLTERINCIVTEASKFINNLYTYCGYVTGSITLEAIGTAGSQVNMNLGQIQWRFTPVDLGTVVTGTPTVPNCANDGNPLTCRLDDLTLDDGGIYEVYRAPRYRRTWHPIFCLYVRECPKNFYGAGCDTPCTPSCVNGLCDPSGVCLCYPGWEGNDCNTPCGSNDVVGQDCDLTCTDICDDADECKDLLFCLPGKLGCYCRSGLQPPDCWKECEPGYWGPNCVEECDPPCDPRTGADLS